jgi:uncharacterized LabA/DUF88 family protein
MPDPLPRVVAFIDGFNLYHALDELRAPHLTWVNLRKLSERFARQSELRSVFYFSAFATWRPEAYSRHRAYVKALESCGVDVVMGQFKRKDRKCRACGATWVGHEKKETDVNIALHLLNEAYKDSLDGALPVSNDSDIAPAVRMLKREFPRKWVRILTPPNKTTSKELVQAAGGPANVRSMKRSHVADALLPSDLTLEDGSNVRRPLKYDPPA